MFANPTNLKNLSQIFLICYENFLGCDSKVEMSPITAELKFPRGRGIGEGRDQFRWQRIRRMVEGLRFLFSLMGYLKVIHLTLHQEAGHRLCIWSKKEVLYFGIQ
jgi:hypothetical protein